MNPKLKEGYNLLKEHFELSKLEDEKTNPALKEQSLEQYLYFILDIDQVIDCILER